MINLRLVSWNINSIRAGIKKGFWDSIKILDADVICLQELKCQDPEMEILFGAQGIGNTPEEESLFDTSKEVVSNSYEQNFVAFWHTCRLRKGYSGVAMLVNKRLINNLNIEIEQVISNLGNELFDIEGRTIGLKLSIEGKKIVLLNSYYPQGGREGRVRYKIAFYEMLYWQCKEWIEQGFEIILTGDLNTTVKDIDLARPKENKKTTGCLPEERIALNWLIEGKEFNEEQLKINNLDFEDIAQKKFKSLNMIDTFRYFNPDLVGQYSYWDQITRARERNVGWRIDYFLITQNLSSNLKQAMIHPQIIGSDHCPVSIDLQI